MLLTTPLTRHLQLEKVLVLMSRLETTMLSTKIQKAAIGLRKRSITIDPDGKLNFNFQSTTTCPIPLKAMFALFNTTLQCLFHPRKTSTMRSALQMAQTIILDSPLWVWPALPMPVPFRPRNLFPSTSSLIQGWYLIRFFVVIKNSLPILMESRACSLLLQTS